MFPVRALVLGTAISVLVASSGRPAHASHDPEQPHRYYAQSELDRGTNGLGGYIRHSGVAMTEWGVDAILGNVTLLNKPPSPFVWATIGVLQGKGGQCVSGTSNCIRSSGSTMFRENTRPGGLYSLVNLGPPPTPNYPYFIVWDGISCSGYCTFDFYTGSLSHRVGTAVLHNSAPFPRAGLEMRNDENGPIPMNTDWFGLDDSGAVTTSRGMRLYVRSQNKWYTWLDTTFPYTRCVDTGALDYVPSRYYDGFQVSDDSSVVACD